MEEAKEAKASNLAEQLNNFNKVFNQTDQVTSNEIVEFIDAKSGEVNSLSDGGSKDILLDGEVLISRADVIKLQVMVDDYKEVREVLLDTTRNGQKILDGLTLDLMDFEDGDSKSEIVNAYANLVGKVNQSVKILASAYKDISSVLINLDKLDKSAKEKDGNSSDSNGKNITVNGNVSISNEQNNEVISTSDLIARLRGRG
jgi:hypothetical protein